MSRQTNGAVSPPAARAPLEPLEPLRRAVGSPLDVAAFHARVNIAFHDAEATCYDQLHRDLWRSLPRVMNRLAGEALGALDDARAGLRVLDIGCGTGLASALLLDSPLGQRVASIGGVDTSPAMLERFRQRATAWTVPTTSHPGMLEDAPAGPFDLIVTCSVLHHVPDLGPFLAAASRRQAPGGVLVHLQDPNGDALGDEALAVRLVQGARATAARRRRNRRLRFLPWRLARALWRRRSGRAPTSYVDTVNDRLREEGVITRPMTSEELWSVTDIHVDGLPYSHGRGISRRELAGHLDAYELIAHCSYAFFGPLASNLPPELARREATYFERGETNGRQLACVWQKRDMP